MVPAALHLTAGVGAAVGAAAGVGVALIAAPVVGAAIALGAIGAGAYAGSLQGAVAGMETDPSKQVGDLAIRPAGAMLAVRIDSPAQEQDVIGALYEAGARVVERTQGIWRDGEWADFDPVSTPQIVAPLQRAQGA